MPVIDWQAVVAVSEAVAAVGVILSLVYVGAQVRQGTMEARVGMLRSIVNELGRVHDSLSEHGDLAEIVVRGFTGYGGLSVVERARMSSYLAHMFKLFEQLYALHTAGGMPAEDWAGLERAIADIGAYPGVQEWWTTRRHWMRADFGRYVEQLGQSPGQANIFLERSPT